MKKLYLIIFLLSFQNIHSSNPLEKKGEKEQGEQQILPFATHGLTIFLDDSETKIDEFNGAVGLGLLNALYQKASPILTSAYILNNVFIRHGNLKQLAEREKEKVRKETFQNWSGYLDLIQQRLKEMLERNVNPTGADYVQIVDTLNKINSEHMGDVSNIAILESVVDFKESEWDIYWVGNHLVLLIPKTYKPEFKLSQQYQSDPNTKELISGFKLNSLTMSKNLLKELETVKPQKDRGYFIESLSKLFVDGADYKKRGFTLDTMPRWALYLNGHGLPDTFSASLSLDQFKFFLNWLQQKIVTRLLAYCTCYAAGTNFKKIYNGQIKDEIAYSFAIAFQGVIETEAIVTFKLNFFQKGELNPSNIDFVQKKLSLNQPYHFDQFFKAVMGRDVIDFETTLNFIIPRSKEETIRSIYQMKLPGTKWFNIVGSDSLIVSIGNVLAATQEKPLNVLNFALKRNKKTDPRFILLYTPIIPFELVVDTPNEIKFISMMPGKVFHRFEAGIRSTKFTIDEILHQFWPDLTFKGEKAYFIKKITGKASQVLISSMIPENIEIQSAAELETYRSKKEITTITDVLIKTEKNFNTIYALIDGKSYEFRNLQFHEIENYADVISAIEKEFGKEGIEAFEELKKGIKKISEVQLKKAHEIEAKKKTEGKK